MNIPPLEDIDTAIIVLTRLSRRIDNNAADRIKWLADSKFCDWRANRIEARALEQTVRIDDVIDQLKTWRAEEAAAYGKFMQGDS